MFLVWHCNRLLWTLHCPKDRYCDVTMIWLLLFHRIRADVSETPWQRECTAITDRQLINSLLDSMRFVTHFWETTPYILKDAIIVLVQSQCYSINAQAFGPQTPYRVGGLAGDVMRVWVSPVAADFLRDVCLTVSHNHAVFLFSQLILTSTENNKWAMYLTAQYCFSFELIYHQSINAGSLKNTVATIVSLRPERDRNNFKSILFIDNFQIWIGIFNWSLFLRTNWQQFSIALGNGKALARLQAITRTKCDQDLWCPVPSLGPSEWKSLLSLVIINSNELKPDLIIGTSETYAQIPWLCTEIN